MIFGNRSTMDAATRVDARHQAEIKSWWRDWHRYLQAHLHLLTARQAETTHAPSFERSEEAWEQQRADAEQTLKRIPHDRRVVFDRTRDARRGEVHAQLEGRQQAGGASRSTGLDPDIVERETLVSLLQQAEGTGAGTEQWGAVPLGNGWYELQVGALLQAPAAAEYTVTLDEADDRRKRLVLIASVLLVAVVAVWWTWPRGHARAEAAPPTELRINGQAAPVWPVVAVIAIDANGLRVTLPVTATDARQWPTLAEGASGAWWRRTALTPLHLCLPPDLLQAARQLEVRSSGDLPARTYALQPAQPARPDLIATPFGSDVQAARRYGMLEAVTPHPDQPLDTPVQVGPDGPTLRVTGFEVLGAGQDPEVPPDTYRVVVHVAPLTTATWTALDPRIVLQTGLEVRPSAPITVAAGQQIVDVAYLVPAWQRPLAAAWYLTDASTQTTLRWRVTLDAPPSRAEVLRDAFEITVRGQRDTAPNSATVTVELRNLSQAMLVVQNADVTVQQQDRTLPVAALGTAGVAIKPREVRTLTLPLRGIDVRQPLTVAVGAARYRLQF